MAWVRILFSVCLVLSSLAMAREENSKLYLVSVKADTAQQRSQIADTGVALDGFFTDSVTFIGTDADIQRVAQLGFKLERTDLPERMVDDFPSSDSSFHNYAETNAALDELVTQHPDIVSKHVIGKSVEGRDITGVRISSSAAMDSLPTAVFIGCHHAREHLSVEVPLMLAQYLANQYASNPRVKEMVDTREIWVVPMLNPDGAEYDISTGSYKWWRKNRRENSGSSYGVDLNRNYGKGFGGPGSSSSPSSDTYHGPSAFSEPETAAVRDFVRARNKTTVLLSFHTFSELVLWPWGHTEDVISDAKDRSVFETMGKKMATWNRYTPQKSSDLYVASGDTTDWAYDELKIFAFTFELSPSSLFGGGFYPGASAIQPTFAENLEPTLYLIENAADPYGVLNDEVTDPLGIL
ncbi:MAG: zinc carboxypeptidase [Bdellovibrionaceae bacterium]|nr:zinc carboxypeptidase [Pseudobdellovibrionaceae bacterium]